MFHAKQIIINLFPTFNYVNIKSKILTIFMLIFDCPSLLIGNFPWVSLMGVNGPKRTKMGLYKPIGPQANQVSKKILNLLIFLRTIC